MRCSSFRINLSAFLDDELDPRKRKQMELHISECIDCQREMGKLQKMIGIVGSVERPEIPVQLWEETRRKLETASKQPDGLRIFRMPKWSFAPAAAAVLAVLVYLLGTQFFYRHETEPVPLTAYLEEHAISYSEQELPSNLLSELTFAQIGSVTEKIQYDKPISELEMLMEVHYGTYPTNGS